MKRIPHAQNVAKALRSVRLAAHKALKGMNQLASQRMAKGDYTGAEALASKAKEIIQFQAEVDVLRKRWREVCGAGDRASKKSVTPLWTYYQPILKAIVHVGGEARRADLEAQVHRLMAEGLHPADREPMARGNERWQIMVRRSRKALVAERLDRGPDRPLVADHRRRPTGSGETRHWENIRSLGKTQSTLSKLRQHRRTAELLLARWIALEPALRKAWRTAFSIGHLLLPAGSVAVIDPTYSWPLSCGASRAQPLRQPGPASPRFAAGCAAARQ